MTERLTIPAHRTDVEMTQIVLPSHANNHGTVFGGQMAAWIDVCAAVSAQRFARKAVVTASMDEIHVTCDDEHCEHRLDDFWLLDPMIQS